MRAEYAHVSLIYQCPKCNMELTRPMALIQGSNSLGPSKSINAKYHSRCKLACYPQMRIVAVEIKEHI